MVEAQPSNPLNAASDSRRRSWSSSTLTSRKSFTERLMEGPTTTLAGEGYEDFDNGTEIPVQSQKSLQQTVVETLTQVRKATILNGQYLEVLESQEPRHVIFLRSCAGFMAQTGLFAFFVALDVTKAIFAGKALKGTSTVSQSIPIMQALIQILIGTCLALHYLGSQSLRDVFDLRKIIQYSSVGIIFAMAQAFNVLAYTMISVGTIKVVGQTRLMQTTILSVIVFGRRYLPTQWAALCIIMLSAASFCLADLNAKQNFKCSKALAKMEGTTVGIFEMPKDCLPGSSNSEDDSMMLGLSYVLAYNFLSDLGSIVSEKLMKSQSDTEVPYYVQKTWQEISGFPCAILMSFVVPIMLEQQGQLEKAQLGRWWESGHPGGLFMNWGPAIWGALLFATMQSFLSGLVVKKLNALTKLLGKSSSTMLTFFVGDCWLVRKEYPPATISFTSAFAVMLGTLSFMQVKAPKPEPPAAPAVEMSQRS